MPQNPIYPLATAILTVTGALVGRIPMVVIGSVALLAVVAGETFGRAVALAGLRMALGGLPVALARLAPAAVDRVAPEAGDAALAMGPHGEAAARQADAGVGAAARVPVALARRAGGEVPAFRRASTRRQGLGVESRTWKSIMECFIYT